MHKWRKAIASALPLRRNIKRLRQGVVYKYTNISFYRRYISYIYLYIYICLNIPRPSRPPFHCATNIEAT